MAWRGRTPRPRGQCGSAPLDSRARRPGGGCRGERAGLSGEHRDGGARRLLSRARPVGDRGALRHRSEPQGMRGRPISVRHAHRCWIGDVDYQERPFLWVAVDLAVEYERRGGAEIGAMQPYALLWLLVNGNPHLLHWRPARRQAVEGGGAAEIARIMLLAAAVP